MSFITEREVKSVRKRHLCCACDKWIEIGEAAVNWCGVTDGDFGAFYYHPECRSAEIAINREYRLNSDEWMSLRDAESDDRPWIKAEHPLVYLRMCMTREQWAARKALTLHDRALGK